MLRRLYHDQPDSFAFTQDNQAWAEAQMTKYPEGRQASAVIPLLWRAQEQEGWLTRPAIERVADLLGMAYIRVLEVASFYFMFQLQPVGSVAHIQVCGTLSCMLCGAEDLISVCKNKIAPKPHVLSTDGKLSWEEVECLGACTNAPMAQIGKDYYEDLTAEGFAQLLDDLVAGKVPASGPQNDRYGSDPSGGVTCLTEYEAGRAPYNASVQLATDIGDTVKRIDGTEVPLLTPWRVAAATSGHTADQPASVAKALSGEVAGKKAVTKPVKDSKAEKAGVQKTKAADDNSAEIPEQQPEVLSAPRGGEADDLKKISGVGPKLEGVLNELGFWHFEQIAAWTENEVSWVDSRLKFKGRIVRDNWIAQAKDLSGNKV